jgi:hypothetical protein
MRDSTRSRHLEGAMRLFDMFDTPEAREGRRAIYTAFIRKRELGKNEIDYAEKIRADFNAVGIMVKEGLFPKEIALRTYSGVVVHCWEALEKHIKNQRKLRGAPSFMGEFEWFYNESKRYRKKKYPEEKLQLFELDKKEEEVG